MSSVDYRQLLRRAGIVLVAVGLIDIGAMVYAIAAGVAYSSSLNIFAVIAGVLLLRGNLRAASAVHQTALFFIGALITITVLAPLTRPVGLLLVEFQINPLKQLASLAIFVGALMLFSWLVRVLGAPAIRDARAQAGRPLRNPRVPFAVGSALAVVLATVNIWVQRTDFAARAIREARAELGDDYDYHVSSMNYRSNSEGTVVAGVVTAWKSGSVKDVPFSWRE